MAGQSILIGNPGLHSANPAQDPRTLLDHVLGLSGVQQQFRVAARRYARLQALDGPLLRRRRVRLVLPVHPAQADRAQRAARWARLAGQSIECRHAAFGRQLLS